ncbi:hypothetical protein I4U23_023707 [Adineta vaga]|nr:hypothetical protein I4U23_023707 [Adineta vaga]
MIIVINKHSFLCLKMNKICYISMIFLIRCRFESLILYRIIFGYFFIVIKQLSRHIPYHHTMGDRHLFFGNLCHVSLESLRSYCEKYGSIIDLSINRDNESNIYHCFGFLTFQSARSTTQFMSKRPHCISGEEIFVKRALPRAAASIPERLVVTNRLVISHPTKYDKRSLKSYFQKLGEIRKFDYENGFIDFEDYDIVDRILLARPHYLNDKQVCVTKFIPNEKTMLDEQVDHLTSVTDETTFKVKYECLTKEYEEYKQRTENEMTILHKEIERLKEELSDITQIKLDRLIKNQQLFHNQLLQHQFPLADSTHAQMCENFLQTTATKKRKTTETNTNDDYELS